MAATIVLDPRPDVNGDGAFNRVGTGNLGVYATGGIAVTPATLGLTRLVDLNISSPAIDGTTLFVWDAANGKVKAYSALGAEVVNATDISSKTFRFRVLGT